MCVLTNFLRRAKFFCRWLIAGCGWLLATASAQAAVCSYVISNEWNSGLTATITIANNTSSPIQGWSLNWGYSHNRISNSWNATISGSNPYTAANLNWNGNIAPGQSVSFGVQLDKNGGSAEVPELIGAICNSVASSSSSFSSLPASSSSVATSSSAMSSSAISSSANSSISSSSSSLALAERCNWYGSFYPLCAATASGWGWENQQSCISRSTCAAQPAPYGIVGAASSASSLSSLASSSSSSSSSAISNSSSSSSVAVASLKSLANFPIGVAVNAGSETNSLLNSSTSAQQQAIVLAHFNQLTAGNIMKMSYLHPAENTYNFVQADALLAFAQANGLSLHGHTFIWHSDYQVPSWMKNYSGDWSAMLKAHVQTIAAHFAGKLPSWDVVNEALAENGDSSAVNGYRNSIFYQKLGAAYIDQAFIHARAADASADLYYNDYNIETNSAKTTNLLNMVDGMLARGVPISGVGFQMHVLPDWPSIANIEASFRAVAQRGLKVKITELDVRVNNPYNSSLPVYTSLTAAAAAAQKQRYYQIIAAYLRAVPAAQRGGITVWGIWDADSWLNTSSAREFPLLFDDNFQAKPALQGFADALLEME